MRRNLILPVVLAGTILLLSNTVQATAPSTWHQTKAYPEILPASCGAAYIICFDVTTTSPLGGSAALSFDDLLGTDIGGSILFNTADGGQAIYSFCGNSTLPLMPLTNQVIVEILPPAIACNGNGNGDSNGYGATIGTVTIRLTSK